MTDDASGEVAGGPVPPAPAFKVRQVPPPTAAERQTRRDAMDRAIRFGAAPYRDAAGKARYVFFKEANNAPVEAWRRDPEAKRGFRRTQQVRKAAGQLIWHPEDQIELAKRLGVIHYREGRSTEGAAERGLHDAIWRYEHVWDSFTVPRRFGREVIETGRIAAVAEEEARKLQAEDPRAKGGFWVRDRKNNGLIYVVPNADPEAEEGTTNDGFMDGAGSREDNMLFEEEGQDTVLGQAEVVAEPKPANADVESPQAMDAANSPAEDGLPAKLNYPDVRLPTLQPTWHSSSEKAKNNKVPPIINMEQDRIRNILANKPARFDVVESPAASGDEPSHADHWYGYWAVWIHQDVIEHEAKRQGVDPNLVKALVYVENAQGWYGPPVEVLRLAKTIFPMNINPTTWAGLVGENADFYDPITNIRAGVVLIRRVQERLEAPTVAKVASPFKFTGRELVSDYGARVAQVYATRAWEKRPLPQIYPESDKPADWEPEYEGYGRRREELKKRLLEEDNFEHGSDEPIVGPTVP